MNKSLNGQNLWEETSSLPDGPLIADSSAPLFDVDQSFDTHELSWGFDRNDASHEISTTLDNFKLPTSTWGFKEKRQRSSLLTIGSESQGSNSFSPPSTSRHFIPSSDSAVAWPSIRTESSFSDFVRSSRESTADESAHAEDSPNKIGGSDDSQPPQSRSSLRRSTRAQRVAASPTPHERTRIHRKAEKKYRSKLATSLDRLRTSVPSLLGADEEDSPEARRLGITTTRKRSKATTISKAVEFIERLQQEHQMLQSRLMSSECEIACLRMQNEELRMSMGNVLSTNVTALGAQLLTNLECFKQSAEHDVYAIIGS